MKNVFVPNKLGRPIPPGISLQSKSPGPVGVNWAQGELCHFGGRRCKLSALETALLACLARRAGTPVSRDEILSQVWKLDPRRTTTRTIDMHISHLRRKLNHADGEKVLITIHRLGYMLQRDAISCDAMPPFAMEKWESTRGNKPFSVV